MKTKLTKAFSADVSIVEGERAVVAKITTAAVDRDGEVLIPQGCNTRDFEKNPVVFLNHNYYSLPVAKCTSIKRGDKEIIAKTVFPERPENHPEGQEWVPDTLLSLFKQGVIRGFSVGFIPVESRPASNKDVENFGADCRRVYSKWKLLEYSVAPLPANQEAVATAVAKSIISAETAEKLFGFKAGEMPENPEDEDECEKMECAECGEECEPNEDGSCPECGKPMKGCEEGEKPAPKRVDIELVPVSAPRRVVLVLDDPPVEPKQVRIEGIDIVNAAIQKKRGRIHLA